MSSRTPMYVYLGRGISSAIRQPTSQGARVNPCSSAGNHGMRFCLGELECVSGLLYAALPRVTATPMVQLL